MRQRQRERRLNDFSCLYMTLSVGRKHVGDMFFISPVMSDMCLNNVIICQVSQRNTDVYIMGPHVIHDV